MGWFFFSFDSTVAGSLYQERFRCTPMGSQDPAGAFPQGLPENIFALSFNPENPAPSQECEGAKRRL